jgi:hypothetical protein
VETKTWYFAIGQQHHGPVTEEEIKKHIRNGKISNNSPVWAEGLPRWVRLDSTELLKYVSAPPPLEPVQAEPNSHRSHSIELKGLPEKLRFEHEAGVGLSQANMHAIGHVATRTNVMAFVAIALAIGSFFTFGTTLIPAIVCGHIALAQFRKDETIGGHGMAVAALAMSYSIVGLVGLVILIAIIGSLIG